MTVLSGYTTTYDFWSTRFSQLSLEEISLHLTIDQITSGFVQKPDPNVRLDHNRAIKLPHAEKFAEYLIRGVSDTTGKWPVIVPALSLFTSPLAVEFETNADFQAGEVEFGIVRIEKSSPVQIWDGQHRTLGAYLAVERLNRQISDLLHLKSKDEDAGNVESTAGHDALIGELRRIRRRLGQIVIPVSIALETDKERIAELFADVADNAKGINATALARLDQRNVFNRVAGALYDGHDGWNLLDGNVDDDNAYVTQSNPHWTTYRDVAATAQIAWLGYGARWTAPKEETGLAEQENDILANAKEFYEVLVEAFPDVEDVLSEAVEPSELRGGGSRTSLLSSSTTVKALASAFHDLKFGRAWADVGTRSLERRTDLPPMSRDDIAAAFKNLPPMASAKNLDQFWRKLEGVFAAPWVAPTARANNARTISVAITEHARMNEPMKS